MPGRQARGREVRHSSKSPWHGWVHVPYCIVIACIAKPQRLQPSPSRLPPPLAQARKVVNAHLKERFKEDPENAWAGTLTLEAARPRVHVRATQGAQRAPPIGCEAEMPITTAEHGERDEPDGGDSLLHGIILPLEVEMPDRVEIDVHGRYIPMPSSSKEWHVSASSGTPAGAPSRRHSAST